MSAREEPVRLDPERLQSLFDELGERGAEEVVCRAMEEIAVRLSVAERLHDDGRYPEMRRSVRSLVGIADQIGLRAVSRIAGDVTASIDAGDVIALSATLSRLLRVSERSLTAIWDIQDMRI